MHGDTGLTDLPVVVYPSGVDGGAAGAYLSVEFLSEFKEHVKTFLRAHTVTTCHDDRSALEIVLGSLYVAVDDLHGVGGGRDIVFGIGIYYLALGFALIESLLHHAGAHGSHLRTMVGVDDGCHDVSAESRTDGVEHVSVVLAALFVVVVADLQLGAVSGQSGGQGC